MAKWQMECGKCKQIWKPWGSIESCLGNFCMHPGQVLLVTVGGRPSDKYTLAETVLEAMQMRPNGHPSSKLPQNCQHSTCHFDGPPKVTSFSWPSHLQKRPKSMPMGSSRSPDLQKTHKLYLSLCVAARRDAPPDRQTEEVGQRRLPSSVGAPRRRRAARSQPASASAEAGQHQAGQSASQGWPARRPQLHPTAQLELRFEA